MTLNSPAEETNEHPGILQPDRAREYNLQSYKETAGTFTWQQAVQGLSAAPDGKWNAAYECIDRHVKEGFGNKTALLFTDGKIEETYTFEQVKDITDDYARVLQRGGVKKGSRVFIFLPKSPDCYFTILAVIKAGAIAGPLFEAFKEDAVKERMSDCEAEFLVTDSDLRTRVPEEALPSLLKTWEIAGLKKEAAASSSGEDEDPLVWLGEEDGMLIHYTSGSTGQPKGIVLAQRALSHQYISGRWVLDIKDDDVYWCTSHPGWVTGSVYGVFAPWLNRAAVVIHGGRFDAGDWYRVIEQFGVTVWYSAPTAFRMLMSDGSSFEDYDLSSLRHILSVGEPLNPEVIYWANRNLGVRIHDTWWMTETGAHLIVNLPSAPIKPGSMGRPLPGIKAAILNEKNEPLPPGETGELAVKAPWPGLMKTVWKNEEKYRSYFTDDDWYLSGDTAYQDDEGYIFFNGRNDDLINTAGERVGPFEVESKLIEHPAVAEAGVIGKPDAVRGEIIKAFVTLREGFEGSSHLEESIRFFVREELSAHAAPREIEIVDFLPKTKISGKILRRELKARELTRKKEA
ncbi:acetate--CoA ligase [Alteribacter lacisalsi]|uniref:acetate--CoA ligase n=1 Tax=Alteribacter lacisalsi TaxID=2045244 RepID=A0A2W0H5H6_9BACI|nr:acetate--CoA ligase [Alteribacter lacisalsi]PYZ97104.1 acetate--CoA ligase [Alteribacter lacisalsi]